MDFDPDSPLNRAHTRERQAEDHFKAERFDSATDCYTKSISNLKDALSLTSNAKARESIEAQIQKNENRIQLAHKKKELLIQRLRDQMKKQELMEQQQIKSAAARMARIELSDDSKDLGMRIVQAMDEHDSLLQVLLQKGGREETSAAGISSPTASMSGSTTASYRSGGKVPKGDKTIIEELQVSNEQLRILVEQLVNELAALRNENDRLRNQVTDLMNDQSSHLPQLPPLEQPKLLY